VVGGLALATVTRRPNAVSAVYLATKGRGAAVLSTALNSNSLNVVPRLLLPVVIGLTRPSSPTVLIAGWYAGLTVPTLALVYVNRGKRSEPAGQPASWCC